MRGDLRAPRRNPDLQAATYCRGIARDAVARARARARDRMTTRTGFLSNVE